MADVASPFALNGRTHSLLFGGTWALLGLTAQNSTELTMRVITTGKTAIGLLARNTPGNQIKINEKRILKRKE